MDCRPVAVASRLQALPRKKVLSVTVLFSAIDLLGEAEDIETDRVTTLGPGGVCTHCGACSCIIHIPVRKFCIILNVCAFYNCASAARISFEHRSFPEEVRSDRDGKARHQHRRRCSARVDSEHRAWPLFLGFEPLPSCCVCNNKFLDYGCSRPLHPLCPAQMEQVCPARFRFPPWFLKAEGGVADIKTNNCCDCRSGSSSDAGGFCLFCNYGI